MQLIIPMSGVGERFKRAGYKIPKPLIEIENESIISHVVRMFPGIESVVFICNEKHLKDNKLNMKDKLLAINPNSKIVSIEPHKKGPIYAILKAMEFLNLDSPTIVNYCDFNCLWDFDSFKKHVQVTNCDGCVVTYQGFHPHMLRNTNYAYLKLKNDQIIDIQEKKPFTSSPMDEYASSGTYYFKSASLMKKYFIRTLNEDLNLNGEYYVSLSYKPMIHDRLKLNNFNIDYFMQWGTPEDMEEYLWFSNLFKEKIKNNNQKKLSLNGQLIIPCAGLGKRFEDAGYNYPKPLIEVSKKPMLFQAINDLPNFDRKKVILRDNMKSLNILTSKIKKYLPQTEVQFIKEITRGQAETCLMGLKGVNQDLPLLISACDNGIIFNQNKLNELLEDKSIDIIVFGSRGFPGAIKAPEMYGWVEDNNNLIKKIHVKRKYKNPLKDPVIVGTFLFKKAHIFKLITEELIKSDKKINNEFYVDTSINNAIDLGYKVVLFEVGFYICWGTPNELKTYNYWQNCFNKWFNHSYEKEKDKDFYE